MMSGSDCAIGFAGQKLRIKLVARQRCANRGRIFCRGPKANHLYRGVALSMLSDAPSPLGDSRLTSLVPHERHFSDLTLDSGFRVSLSSPSRFIGHEEFIPLIPQCLSISLSRLDVFLHLDQLLLDSQALSCSAVGFDPQRFN